MPRRKFIFSLALILCFCGAPKLVFGASDFIDPIFGKAANSTLEPIETGREGLFLEARAGVVLDVTTGKILYEKNGFTPFSLASLTKIMTANVVLEEKTSFDRLETYYPDDSAEGAKVNFRLGDKTSVRNLFFAALVPSANNATKTLADSTGLPRARFISKMNQKAKTLGLNSMHFDGVTGLEPGNKSSALDFAKFSVYALRKFNLLVFTTSKGYCFRTANTNRLLCVKSTNKLLNSRLYVTGGKTGFLPPSAGGAGSSLMIKAKKNGHEVIAVVLGHPNYQRMFIEVENMINWSYRNYQWSK